MILPKMNHIGSLCPEGGLFQAGGIVKGQGFHKLKLHKGRKFRYM